MEVIAMQRLATRAPHSYRSQGQRSLLRAKREETLRHRLGIKGGVGKGQGSPTKGAATTTAHPTQPRHAATGKRECATALRSEGASIGLMATASRESKALGIISPDGNAGTHICSASAGNRSASRAMTDAFLVDLWRWLGARSEFYSLIAGFAVTRLEVVKINLGAAAVFLSAIVLGSLLS